MKIGIITIPPQANYGGILQAYALQTIIQRMGHEVVILDKNKTWSLRMLGIYARRFMWRYIKRDKSAYVFLERHNSIIRQNTNRFISENLSKASFKSFDQIPQNSFDALIVGSDQVWRPIYFPNISDAFLDFAKDWKNIKRIAYATSFGTDEEEYNKEQVALAKKLIQLFDAVSVREREGVNLCRNYFNIKASHVLDPTMLLNTSDYKSLIRKSSAPNRQGILTYILDSNSLKESIINKVEELLNIKAFSVTNNTYNSSFELSEHINPSVEDWLKGFTDADFVITDSFHGSVFAILFNIPFLIIGNKERGMTRFDSLLATFKLNDRMFTSINEVSSIIDKKISWDNVNNILKSKRIEAFNFLTSSLK